MTQELSVVSKMCIIMGMIDTVEALKKQKDIRDYPYVYVDYNGISINVSVLEAADNEDGYTARHYTTNEHMLDIPTNAPFQDAIPAINELIRGLSV